jgi:hypothetical protein
VTLEQTTSRSDGTREGFAGLPDVGEAAGSVAVVWFGNPTGSIRAMFSSDGGADLMAGSATAMTLVGSSPNDGRRYAAAAGSPTDGDGRVTVAFTTNGALLVRTWDGATLGPAIAVASFPSVLGGVTYPGAYGPAVLPAEGDGLFVAFAGCRARSGVPDPCDASDPAARIDLLFTESTDGGASWTAIQRLAEGTTSRLYRTNDEPSVALTFGKRRIAFDSYGSTFERYRVRMRSSR